ncbi:hypothetical protein NLU13_9844 [Sarocladium strictum]|uniref:Uncharacterized protein n=1 Tax=Sarocladium strictum TaxID=5046 RepID=A0AA39G8Q1_SARSR|nr:hypothetical protein NLU13_9844 [Sarocladium strictum]
MRSRVPPSQHGEFKDIITARVLSTLSVRLPDEQYAAEAVGRPISPAAGPRATGVRPFNTRRRRQRRSEQIPGNNSGAVIKRHGLAPSTISSAQIPVITEAHAELSSPELGIPAEQPGWVNSETEAGVLAVTAGASTSNSHRIGDLSRCTEAGPGGSGWLSTVRSPILADSNAAQPPQVSQFNLYHFLPNTFETIHKQQRQIIHMHPMSLPEGLDVWNCAGTDESIPVIAFAGKREPGCPYTTVARNMVDALNYSRYSQDPERSIIPLPSPVVLHYSTGPVRVTEFVKNFRVYPASHGNPVVFDAFVFPLPQPQHTATGWTRVSDEALSRAWYHDHMFMGAKLLERLEGGQHVSVSASSGGQRFSIFSA